MLGLMQALAHSAAHEVPVGGTGDELGAQEEGFTHTLLQKNRNVVLFCCF